MFCTRCGQPVAQGSVFCSHCGHALSVPAEPPQPPQAAPQPVYPENPNIPPQGYYYTAPEPQGYGTPVKKKSTGLIVGLSVGGAAVLVLIAVLLFIWPGFLSAVPVSGIWYSDSRGEAIVFGAGHSFDAYTHYGDFEGDYEYDKSARSGQIVMNDDREFDFFTQNGKLYVDGMGEFIKADDRFDIEDFIDDAMDEFETGESGS